MKLISITTNIVLFLVYLSQLVALTDATNARAASTNRISSNGDDSQTVAINVGASPSLHRVLRGRKKKNKSKKTKKKCKKQKSKKSKKNKNKNKKKNKKNKDCENEVPVLPDSCFLLNEGLGENETAPVSSEDCGSMYESLTSLQNDTFAREDFEDFFNEVLVQGINSFILNATSSSVLAGIAAVEYENLLDRLEEFIFDENVTLNDSDFSALLAHNFTTARISVSEPISQEEIAFETPGAINAYLKKLNGDIPSKKEDYSVALSPTNRKLVDDNELTPECLDVIIRIVVEVIGLILTGIGIRGIVTRPFKTYFVMVKRGKLNGLVLEAYKQSKGEFDFSFFAGLVVSFLSILTWKDIKSSLDSLKDFNDWFSLALGLILAIGSVMLTSGLALIAAVGSVLLQANSLKGDIEDLGQCFALCSQGYTQSGGQSTQTFIVGLDRSKGDLTLSYEMYRIPDRLDLIYEGNTIFTTGGLVSGSRTITRTIDGDAEQILVKITAPNSGTAWRFTLDCPVPNLFRI